MESSEVNNKPADAITFELAHSEHKTQWDAFVLAQAEASPYHLFAWGEAVKKAYGFDMHYWMAKEADSHNIVAILPAIKVRNLRGKASICSLPYCDLGGILAKSPEYFESMFEHVRHVYSDSSANSKYAAMLLELRNKDAELLDIQSAPEGEKVRMLLSLPESSDELMTQFKSKLRSQIRKAEKNGLSFKITKGNDANIASRTEEFYKIIAANMHLLGSPVHSKAWYEQIIDAYGEHLYIATVYFENIAVGAAMVITTNNKAVVPWASTLADYNRLAPNMLLYWAVLSEATDLGMQEFDFGRSTVGEGTYNFKKQWGALPQKLSWQEYDNGQLQAVVSTTQSKARALVENIWRRLPLSLSTALGSKIRKFISL